MDPWYGLYDDESGDLQSIGTSAMFEGGKRPKGNSYNGLRIVDFGDERPDLSAVMWDAEQRSMVARPPEPEPKTSADLLIEALAEDAAWTALSRQQQQQLETAIRSADERKDAAKEVRDARIA